MPLRSCIDLRFPPALNALPLPVRMIALTLRSAPSARSVSIMSSQSAWVPIAFMLSGFAIVRIAILSRRSTCRNSPTPVLLFQPPLADGAAVAQRRDPRRIIADIGEHRIGIRADLWRGVRRIVDGRRIARRRETGSAHA